ncbi:MAG: ATP-binding protein [Dissulfurispiraceae bacterium]
MQVRRRLKINAVLSVITALIIVLILSFFKLAGAGIVIVFLFLTAAALINSWIMDRTITDHQQAEERSRRLASFPELNPNPIIEIDSSGNVIFCNQSSLDTLESLGMDKGDVDAFLPPDLEATLGDWDKGNETTIYREVIIKDRVFSETIQLLPQFEVARIYAADITARRHAEKTLKRAHDELELKVMQRTSELSITNEKLFAQLEERKRAADRISRLNRLYSVLSKVNETIVRIHDSDELYYRVCRIAVEDGLFKMAWIGLIDPGSRIVKPVASYGDTDGYLNGVKIYASDVPEGRGPTGTAAFEGRYSISGDIEHDPRMLPWRERASRHGLRSSAAFPIHAGSSVIGALTVYSSKSYFFTDEEIQLLTSLTEDVSFAIDFMANERKRLEAEEALRIINEELEQRIAARTADLEAANKELESFSYSVSHDLRAPLRHMLGFMKLLQQKLGYCTDVETSHYMDAISAASKKMGMLIDDLLAFSRISRVEIRKEKVSFNALVRAAVGDIQHEAAGRYIIWDIDELPEVYGDQSMLGLVLANIISNAVKYTSTCPRAEIRIGYKEDDDEFIFFVKDNGVGFDMKYVNKLFGVFQRLHSQDEFKGTGIGLANVQRIITRHDGRVWAEGAVGQGAAFYFTLPKIKET